MTLVVVVPPPPAPAGAALLDTLPTPVTLSGAIGVALPLLVGLISTRQWPAPMRGVLLLVLSLVTAGTVDVTAQLVETGAAGPLHWQQVLSGAVAAWITGQTAHASLWRRSAISARLQDLGSLPHGPAHQPDRPTAAGPALRRDPPLDPRAPSTRHRATRATAAPSEPRHAQRDEQPPTTRPERLPPR